MPSRDYHEASGRAPAGLEPPDFALRRRFLLEHVARRASACSTSAAARALRRRAARGAGAQVVGDRRRRGAAAPRARARTPELDLRLGRRRRALAARGRELRRRLGRRGDRARRRHRRLAVGGPARAALGRALLLSTPAHGRLALLRLALSERAFAAHFDPRADHLRFYTRAGRSRRCSRTSASDCSASCRGPPGARRLLLAALRGTLLRCSRRRGSLARFRALAPSARSRARVDAAWRGRAQRLDVVVVDFDRFGVASGAIASGAIDSGFR